MAPRSRSPTLWLLLVTVVVFALQLVLSPFVQMTALLGLSLPVAVQPWTVLTSLFAHGSPSHLLANLVGLAVAGVIVERHTTPWRYLVFALGAGAVAGISQVVVAGVLGQEVTVLGASGIVLALVGYLLTSNRLSAAVIGGVSVSASVQLVAFAALAAGIVLLTDGGNVAHVAHFTGLLLGLVAGRLRLLRPRGAASS
jgi:membrane associated rhomboid family serine protease